MTVPRMAKCWLARAVVITITAAAGFAVGFGIGGKVSAGVAFALFAAFAVLPYAAMVAWKE